MTSPESRPRVETERVAEMTTVWPNEAGYAEEGEIRDLALDLLDARKANAALRAEVERLRGVVEAGWLYLKGELDSGALSTTAPEAPSPAQEKGE